ncbi:MAG: substrate-binding domain-containing protein, partial [Lentisphaerota bacterium]
LREQAISIPSAVAVTGFDDSEVAVEAGLTSVRVPAYAAGRESVRLLSEKLKQKVPLEEPRHFMMEMLLQIRHSSCKSPGIRPGLRVAGFL